ncbi:Holliday junction resolvase RuvX [Candidatus Kaiserbacteria bacterium]|nr:Holliday junction resolvase RuvX [Candidatus Kaiserbacteria bacterium]
MRSIGIDYGSSRIGIAVSDAQGSIAFPRAVIPNDGNALKEIARIVREESISAAVVGDARAFSGGTNAVTAAADAFARELERILEMPVRRVAEAWSSAEAARFAPKGKTHDDSAAAAIILQRFLDMKGNRVE